MLCILKSVILKEEFTIVADRWLECVKALGGDAEKGTLPDTNFRAFNFDTMKPLLGSVPEPEAAGAMGWPFLYGLFTDTRTEIFGCGKTLYGTFLSFTSNPSYDCNICMVPSMLPV